MVIFIKVIVIGGGASGLVAAIYASLNNDVTILEKNSKCGRKILVSGNGKCNYFNSDFTIKHFNTENDKLSRHCLSGNERRFNFHQGSCFIQFLFSDYGVQIISLPHFTE